MKRFIILMYHSIRVPQTPREARYACPPERFRQHLAWLRRHCALVSLAQIEAAFVGTASLPDEAVAITLDDGHGDNYTHAFPILQALQIPATVFLATGYLGKTNAWMQGFPQHPMLTWDQVRDMHRHGITFGAHTVTHPRLPELPPDQAQFEIQACKQQIESIIGAECRYFAYPYGLYNEAILDFTRQAGYRLACSTRSGFNHLERNPYLLHRLEVQGTDALWQLKLKLRFGSHQASLAMPLRYYASRLKTKLLGG